MTENQLFAVLVLTITGMVYGFIRYLEYDLKRRFMNAQRDEISDNIRRLFDSRKEDDEEKDG